MTASDAFEVAKAAESAWYASYEQHGNRWRPAGFEPSTSHRTRQLWYAANTAWLVWRLLHDAEQREEMEERAS